MRWLRRPFSSDSQAARVGTPSSDNYKLHSSPHQFLCEPATTKSSRPAKHQTKNVWAGEKLRSSLPDLMNSVMVPSAPDPREWRAHVFEDLLNSGYVKQAKKKDPFEWRFYCTISCPSCCESKMCEQINIEKDIEDFWKLEDVLSGNVNGQIQDYSRFHTRYM